MRVHGVAGTRAKHRQGTTLIAQAGALAVPVDVKASASSQCRERSLVAVRGVHGRSSGRASPASHQVEICSTSTGSKEDSGRHS